MTRWRQQLRNTETNHKVEVEKDTEVNSNMQTQTYTEQRVHKRNMKGKGSKLETIE